MDPHPTIVICSLQRQLAQDGDKIFALKKALLPFAHLLQDHNDFDPKGQPYPDDKPIFAINSVTITLGDLRAAKRELLS